MSTLGGQQERAAATAELAAWCAALTLTVDDDGAVLVQLDGHDPASLTAAVVRAAFLVAVESAPSHGTFTDALGAAREVLAAADVDAAMRDPVEQARARDRMARERRRQIAAEAAEQVRLRADLVAVLDTARSMRSSVPDPSPVVEVECPTDQ